MLRALPGLARTEGGPVTTQWVTFTVADGPDVFDTPSIGMKMDATVEYTDGTWTATYKHPGGYVYQGAAGNQTEALLRLVADRLMVTL